jgi:hypothetical protein
MCDSSQGLTRFRCAQTQGIAGALFDLGSTQQEQAARQRGAAAAQHAAGQQGAMQPPPPRPVQVATSAARRELESHDNGLSMGDASGGVVFQISGRRFWNRCSLGKIVCFTTCGNGKSLAGSCISLQQFKGDLMSCQAAALASRFASGGVELPRGGLQNGQQPPVASDAAATGGHAAAARQPSGSHAAEAQRSRDQGSAPAQPEARFAAADDASSFLSSLELLPPPPRLVRDRLSRLGSARICPESG